jgi:sortase A
MASLAKITLLGKIFRNCLVLLGAILLFVSVYLLVRLTWSPLKHEVQYVLHTPNRANALDPVNKDFSLVIDKLGISSAIIQDVEASDSQRYQLALTRGIAHAKGTNLPGTGGNIFLFAHSSSDLFTAQIYNSAFYLIHHLDLDDEIKIYFKNQLYLYKVSAINYISPSDTSPLTKHPTDETLTLMTCWPPGTTLSRLVVSAKLANY